MSAKPNEARGLISPQELAQPGFRLVYASFVFIAVAAACAMLFPIFWVFASALKAPGEIYRVPQTFLPSEWRWENFAAAWDSFMVPQMMSNTFVVYLGFLASRLFVDVLAAYALSKSRLPYREGFYLLFLATLMLPTAAYLVPSYLVIKDLGLYDSWWALWLPAGASSMNILLIKGFFDGIPKELSEASRMDGASEGRILLSVILPNAKPILAAIGIFTFLEIWNNFFWQRLILADQDRWTVGVMLWYRTSVIGGNPPMNVQLAGMFISLVPPLILFLLFQRHITEGVTLSGIKG